MGMKRDIYILGVSELEVLLDLVLAKLSTLLYTSPGIIYS